MSYRPRTAELAVGIAAFWLLAGFRCPGAEPSMASRALGNGGSSSSRGGFGGTSSRGGAGVTQSIGGFGGVNSNGGAPPEVDPCATKCSWLENSIECQVPFNECYDVCDAELFGCSPQERAAIDACYANHLVGQGCFANDNAIICLDEVDCLNGSGTTSGVTTTAGSGVGGSTMTSTSSTTSGSTTGAGGSTMTSTSSTTSSSTTGAGGSTMTSTSSTAGGSTTGGMSVTMEVLDFCVEVCGDLSTSMCVSNFSQSMCQSTCEVAVGDCPTSLLTSSITDCFVVSVIPQCAQPPGWCIDTFNCTSGEVPYLWGN